jgi:predicted N-acetyltransferase YhbS
MADPGHAGGGRHLREDDYVGVRRLLVECLPVSAPGFTWEVRRWDGWRWYRPDAAWDPRWERDARAWDDASGVVVAAAHADGPGEAHLQVHPAHRHLEGEMIAWAEATLAVAIDPGAVPGARRLVTPVREYDRSRQLLLEARGWHRTADWGVTRWLRFGAAPVPGSPVANGYVPRSLRAGERDEASRIAALLNAAFGRSWHDAPEYLTFEEHAPGYDPTLQLVAEAPDGSFAAHVGVTLEPVNRLAIVEPVCTHPDHRRRGLAEALLRQALELARRAGATQACVDTGSREGPNRLYEEVGFLEVYPAWDWEWRS